MRRPLLTFTPEPRLALIVVLLAPLWLVPGAPGRVAIIGMCAALALAIVGDAIALPAASDINVERALPPSIGIGDHLEGEYVVRSRWGMRLHARLADDLPAGVTGGANERDLAVPARGSAHLSVPIVGAVRGRFALGPVALRVRTRAGLVARRLRWRPDDSILVTPSVASVRRFRLLAIQHRLYDAGVRAVRQRGDGRSFASLREYVVGDDPRHIDWKASARRGKTITREFTVEQSQTVFCLVDAGRSMTQLAGAFTRFEHALSATLVLTDVAASAGDRVGALVFDDDVRAFVPAQRGHAALRAMRNALVPVQATLTEPDYAAAFRFLATRQRRRSLIIFFTDVIDARASRALIAHVARSAARHLVVVVALRNDALDAAATPGSVRSESLYETAAAEELIAARAEALERMRASGVTVIDVSPAGLTAAVVNRYLEIKARGAL
ncbi:MAG TPA: DUF58 domain-containing protein [Gemmatimonadaceae bacterium]|jgi:uncharacterized protein (DUF58 family)